MVDIAADLEEVVARLAMGAARVGHLGAIEIEHVPCSWSHALCMGPRTWFSVVFPVMQVSSSSLSSSSLAAASPPPPLTLTHTHQTKNLAPTLTHTHQTLAQSPFPSSAAPFP